MPIINIKLTNPLPDDEMKNKIAQEITDIMVKNLNKNPQRVVISFEEVNSKDIFFGAKSVYDIVNKG